MGLEYVCVCVCACMCAFVLYIMESEASLVVSQILKWSPAVRFTHLTTLSSSLYHTHVGT